MSNFEQKIKGSLYGFGEYDYADVIVTYDIDPEYRSWGIKGQYVDIKSVGVTALHDSEPDVDLDIKEFKIINDAKFDEWGAYSFVDCEIDTKRKTITLS